MRELIEEISNDHFEKMEQLQYMRMMNPELVSEPSTEAQTEEKLEPATEQEEPGSEVIESQFEIKNMSESTEVQEDYF